MEPESLLPLSTKRVSLTRLGVVEPATEEDLVAIEEPLEIRVNGKPVAVTMRTPGDDEELCAGWLVSEGVVRRADDLAAVNASEDLVANIVEAQLAPAVAWDLASLKRDFYATSSCGVCGKAAIDALAVPSERIVSDLRVDGDIVTALPARLNRGQGAFARTGGLHAAGLFNAAGEAIAVREDVGRHNALDKTIGWALLNDRLPLSDTLICVSGRLSFELVQKAALAGSPLLAGVSAPTSLAIQLGEERGITLCGFVRNGQMNVYTLAERISA